MLRLILTNVNSQPPDFMLIAQNMQTFECCGFSELHGLQEIEKIPQEFSQRVLSSDYDDYLTLAEISQIKGYPIQNDFVFQRAKLRQFEYARMVKKENNSSLIGWNGDELTVDNANIKWGEYAAEDSMKSDELQELIKSAKEYIRSLYPDIEQQI